jgi:hypothetical protein
MIPDEILDLIWSEAIPYFLVYFPAKESEVFDIMSEELKTRFPFIKIIELDAPLFLLDVTIYASRFSILRAFQLLHNIDSSVKIYGKFKATFYLLVSFGKDTAHYNESCTININPLHYTKVLLETKALLENHDTR